MSSSTPWSARFEVLIAALLKVQSSGMYAVFTGK
jgi:hypothetical protein